MSARVPAWRTSAFGCSFRIPCTTIVRIEFECASSTEGSICSQMYPSASSVDCFTGSEPFWNSATSKGHELGPAVVGELDHRDRRQHLRRRLPRLRRRRGERREDELLDLPLELGGLLLPPLRERRLRHVRLRLHAVLEHEPGELPRRRVGRRLVRELRRHRLHQRRQVVRLRRLDLRLRRLPRRRVARLRGEQDLRDLHRGGPAARASGR